MSQLRETIISVLSEDRDAKLLEFKERWVCRGDFLTIVRELDEIISQLGLNERDGIGCLLRSNDGCAALLMAAFCSDHCVVPFNALLPDGRLAEDIEEMRPAVLVGTAEELARPGLLAAVELIGGAAIAVSMTPVPKAVLIQEMPQNRERRHLEVDPAIALQLLTSGTTGRPKRVPLSRDVLERQILASNAREKVNAADAKNAYVETTIEQSSFVHIGGIWAILALGTNGKPVCFLEKFNLPEWRRAIAVYQPGSCRLPPAAVKMVLDADISAEELSCLRYVRCGSAPLMPEMADAMKERYGIIVLTNYGATEFAGSVASWTVQDYQEKWQSRRGAVGRLHEGIEARVIDLETGEVVANGQEGVLELKGFAIGNGQDWLRTSDLARLDNENFLWIVGRADNAINRGGFKIQPEDVVKVLEAHPCVSEASVVGIPDERLGQVPAAAVVLNNSLDTVSDDELKQWVRSRLVAYCVPTVIKFVSELPRTPSMKVSLVEVRGLILG